MGEILPSIVINKKMAKQIEWVMKATSKAENHPDLQTVHVTGGMMETTDGFRVHRWVWAYGFGRIIDDALDKIGDLDGNYAFTITELTKKSFSLGIEKRTIARWPDTDNVILMARRDGMDASGFGPKLNVHADIHPKFLRDATIPSAMVANITIGPSIMLIDYTDLPAGGTAIAEIMMMYTGAGNGKQCAYLETITDGKA